MTYGYKLNQAARANGAIARTIRFNSGMHEPQLVPQRSRP